MAYVSKSPDSNVAKKPSSGSIAGENSKRLPIVIAICSVAILLLGFVAYSSFFKSDVPQAQSDKVAPPPGYPNIAPYNMKKWQEGKMMGGGIPKPPSQGGVPPSASSTPSGDQKTTE